MCSCDESHVLCPEHRAEAERHEDEELRELENPPDWLDWRSVSWDDGKVKPWRL